MGELLIEREEIIAAQGLGARRALRGLECEDAKPKLLEQPIGLLGIRRIDGAGDGESLRRLRLIREAKGGWLGGLGHGVKSRTEDRVLRTEQDD
jgi:hypothetical protein